MQFLLPRLVPEAAMIGVMTGLALGIVVILWWLFFSRAPWSERLGFFLVTVIAMFATSRFIHESVATGMMGLMFVIYSIPVLSLALVLWAVGTRRLRAGPRRGAIVTTVLLICGAWTLVRTDGLSSGAGSDFEWRWSKTPEERLLADAEEREQPNAAPSVPLSVKNGYDWPGFRGPERDSIIRGVRIETDWTSSPPAELWRRPIGPGWSSFAVRNNLIYTQEQRGEEEVVACYNLSTGEPVWKHSDPTRFWESNGGAGPRATPTLSDGRVYSLGATGILNVLAADDGRVVWTRNAATDTGAKTPGWGFAGSPLVIGDSVIVATAGSLIAYDIATGTPRWSGPDGGDGYSSPHLATLNGIEQILLLSTAGATSVSPTDGKLLWQQAGSGFPIIVQPALTSTGGMLIGTDKGMGMLRIGDAQAAAKPIVEEVWSSNRLKPYFNDFVIHAGHAFGFDSGVLACISVEDGTRKWKGGRFGRGQLILLADQSLLIVISEQGELGLVAADPEAFSELARFPAIEGKTWNHPVLVGDLLLVRNDQEMAAFRLALADGAK
jgi:outer membrane protein assembly factor BamB